MVGFAKCRRIASSERIAISRCELDSFFFVVFVGYYRNDCGKTDHITGLMLRVYFGLGDFGWWCLRNVGEYRKLSLLLRI